MSMESDIRSTPEVLQQTLETVPRQASVRDEFSSPALFLGSGSSYCVGIAAARLYEEHRGQPGQVLLPSEYVPRPGWLHVAFSRTGQTSELIEALRRAREVGATVYLVAGDPDSPAEGLADAVISLPFASETGVVQTRFISAAILSQRLLIAGSQLEGLPEGVERGLHAELPPDLPHIVFLGRGWRYGLARSAALTLQESALTVAEFHQTLDYRHGPISCAGPETLVWSFDAPDDPRSSGVIADVRATGATVWESEADPQVMLAQAQLYAWQRATSHGLDPEAPRNLSRAIVLPTLEGMSS